MSVTPDRFRRAMSRLAGGVAIVTTRDREGQPQGMTATAVSSVSLDPPLVMVCLDRAAQTHAAIETFGHYALNFLAEGDADLAVRFGRDDTRKFDGLELRDGESGVPLLERALAHCECSVERAVPAGDHTIFLGRVETTGVGRRDSARPLIHYRGSYRTVEGVSCAESSP